MSLGWEVGGIDAAQRELGRFAGHVGELIVRDSHPGDEAQLRGRIDRVGEIGEPLAVVDAVVNRIGATRSGAEAQVGVRIDAGQKVTELPAASAELETRLRGVALAAVNRELVVRVIASVLGADFHYACCPIAVFGRQDAIDGLTLLTKYESSGWVKVGSLLVSSGSRMPFIWYWTPACSPRM